MNSPLRYLAVAPLLVSVTALAGIALLHGTAVHPRLGEVLLACGICVAAGELALTPMLLTAAEPSARVRAALVGTVIHLAVVLVFAVLIIGLLKPTTAFVFWLLAEYWITLIGLCGAFVLLLRANAPSTGP